MEKERGRPSVRVLGWRDARNPKPVSLAKLVSGFPGLSLRAGKDLIDQLDEHGEAEVSFESAADAERFTAEACALGALVKML